MIQNYFKTALRSMRNNLLTSSINVAGLAISLAACLAIGLYIRKELSYDTTHPNNDRVFRLIEIIDSGDNIENSSSSPYPTMPALAADYPDLIESWVRIFDFQVPVKTLKLESDELFNETGVFYADSSLFDVMDVPLIDGDPAQAINQPFTMVISQRLAAKYYGDENPVGKIIRLNGMDQLKVEITGVLGQGGASHFKPEAIISMATVAEIAPFMTQNWIWNPCWTYIRLAENVGPGQLAERFPEFIDKYYPDRVKNMTTHHLQPVADIHLHSNLEFEMSRNSDVKYLYIFLCSGIFLLIIACVNFINLTTANLASRVKELGVRKVIGATRSQLIGQSLFESLLTTLMGFLLAIVLLALLFPVVGAGLNMDLSLAELLEPGMLGLAAVFMVTTGLLAGLYPAWLYARTDVVAVLKGGLKGSKRGKRFRKALVAFQFSMAVVLMVFTLVSRQQLDFMQSKNNGYVTENVLYLPIVGTQLPQKMEAFRQEMMQHPGVVGVSVMNEVLGINNNNHEFNYEGMPEGDWHYFPALMVDEEFVPTMGIDVLAGRNYDVHRDREDSLSIVINEALAKQLGWLPDEAIGKRLWSLSGREKIIGVVRDFNYKSLHHPVGPFVLDVENRHGHFFYFAKNVVLRVADLNPEVQAHMSEVWGRYVSNKPFDYQLLDAALAHQYAREDVMGRTLGIFSAIAVFVACLGLFALTWFIARQKMREIAIRKVLGASTPHLLGVATKEQLYLVGLSLLAGFPLAFLLVSEWLEVFAYRVNPGISPYLLAGSLAVAIAFLTMLYVAMRAAQRDPVASLKYE